MKSWLSSYKYNTGLAEDRHLIPRTQSRQLTINCNSSSRGSDLFQTLWVLALMCKSPLQLKVKFNLKNKFCLRSNWTYLFSPQKKFFFSDSHFRIALGPLTSQTLEINHLLLPRCYKCEGPREGEAFQVFKGNFTIKQQNQRNKG